MVSETELHTVVRAIFGSQRRSAGKIAVESKKRQGSFGTVHWELQNKLTSSAAVPTFTRGYAIPCYVLSETGTGGGLMRRISGRSRGHATVQTGVG